MSTRSLVGASSLAVARTRRSPRAGRRAGRAAALLVEAEPVHVLAHRLLAELLADLRPHRVDRVGQRGREVIVPKSSPPELLQRHARDRLVVARRSSTRVRRELARVERGDRGHDLERRAGRVARLRRAVEQRRALGLVAARRTCARAHAVGVVVGTLSHHAHLRRCAGSSATTEPLRPPSASSAPAARAGSSVVTTSSPSRSRAGAARRGASSISSLSPGQLVVARLLEARLAERDVGVADRVREQVALRDSGACRSRPGARRAAGQHRAVGGADRAAVDPLLLEQRRAGWRVVAQRLGLEHRPARGEGDQQAEQHDARARTDG